MSKNDDEDFFGFDTRIPVSLKGPQQNFGDVELEDTYDALNDETFGGMTSGGLDDWEEEHEKLAEQLKTDPEDTTLHPSYKYCSDYEEESAYPGPEPTRLKSARISLTGNVEIEPDNEGAASVAARISEMLLDDDDLDSLLTKPMTYSRTIDSQLLENNAVSPSPLFENDMVGANATSIWSAAPSSIPIPQELRGIQPVPMKPELYSIQNMHIQPHGLPVLPQANFKTVEELERDILKTQQQHQQPPQPPTTHQPLTLEELERNILSLNQHNASNMQYVVPNPNGAANHQLNMMMLPPGHPMPAPPMMLNLPPPNQALLAGVPPEKLFANMHGMMHLLRPDEVAMMAAQSKPMPPPMAQPAQDNRGARGGGKYRNDDDNCRNRGVDEYAGLMSTKEKQWLMSIQINQLISDNPFVEDYYFMMLRLKCLDRMHQKPEKPTCSRLIPDKSKIEPKTYAPTQFANSLGKLQVVTYTAPRRIIDVNITQPMSEMQDQFAAKDFRKFKQMLLDIEKLFVWLLALEDAEMRADSAADASIQTHYIQVAEDNLHKLQNFLQSSEKIPQVLLVRKGKVFLLRAWNRLRSSIRETIVKSLFVNCSTLIRKDAQDQMLVRFLPLINDILASLEDLGTLLHYSSCLDSTSRNSSVSSIVSTKIGIDFISLLMCRGAELLPACTDSSVRSNWLSFVNAAYHDMAGLKKPLKSNLGLLNAQLFVQTGVDKNTVSKIKLLVE